MELLTLWASSSANPPVSVNPKTRTSEIWPFTTSLDHSQVSSFSHDAHHFDDRSDMAASRHCSCHLLGTTTALSNFEATQRYPRQLRGPRPTFTFFSCCSPALSLASSPIRQGCLVINESNKIDHICAFLRGAAQHEALKAYQRLSLVVYTRVHMVMRGDNSTPRPKV